MKFIKENRIPMLLCIGLLLFICHYQNQPFVQYIPLFQIGVLILWFTVGFLILNRWKQVKEIGLGPKYIWIPLAVIAGSATLRLFVQHDSSTIAGALFMASMFGLYVISRRYGEKALKLFTPVVIAGAVSIIVQAVIFHNAKNPGLFNNYATAAQFLVFGWLVAPRKWQWWLSGIVLAGLFFSGTEEGIFYVAVIGLVILIRRDWSRRILLPVGVLAGLLLICTPLGMTEILYSRAARMVNEVVVATTDSSLTPAERDSLLDHASDNRWTVYWRFQRPMQPLGYGVNTTNHYVGLPHNIILLVTDQLGPVAACAWMAAMIIGIRKTKWKYGFLALILFGVFQPFVWTEMAPYMWVMAGTATASKVGSSYIFKGAA
jgi:hypothetical protein